MDSSIFEKYASAYLSAITDYEVAIDEIESLTQALKAQPRFITILSSPSIANETKKKMLKPVLDKIKDQMLSNYIYVIIDNGREHYLREILEHTLSHLYDKVGVKRGYVYSALALDDKKVKEIEEAISKRVKAKCRLKLRVDPTLIGGVKVALGDVVYDGSIKKQLEDIQLKLLGGLTNEN